jgi:hypothetical protein
MTSFQQLGELTPFGLERFHLAFDSALSTHDLDISNPAMCSPVPGTAKLVVKEYSTRREMAEAVCAAFGQLKPENEQGRIGLWAWLTWVLRDQLFVPDKAAPGRRKVGELWTWMPSPPNDFRKAQRHKVRLPVILWATLGNDADHLLCGKPSEPGELISQLTSQQDMLARGFQQLCRQLYYDDQKGGLRRGAAGSGAGSARHLARVRKQLDITWDMTDLGPDRIMALLPRAFEKFLPG